MPTTYNYLTIVENNALYDMNEFLKVTIAPIEHTDIDQ